MTIVRVYATVGERDGVSRLLLPLMRFWSFFLSCIYMNDAAPGAQQRGRNKECKDNATFDYEWQDYALSC